MSVHEKNQTRRLLLIGLVASVATVLGGELPIGWVEYPKVANDLTGMLGMMMGSADLSLWQLAAGTLVGGVCIPLQYFGFRGCAELVEAGGSRKAAGMIRAGAAATGFLGGIVHVICVALMFLCRMADFSAGAIPRLLVDFTLWLVLPVSIVFMPVYYAMCIALFVTVVRKKTTLPRWAAVFNPLTGTLVLNALPLLLPPSAFVNALGMANMGLGSVLTFGGLLWLTKKEQQEKAPCCRFCAARSLLSGFSGDQPSVSSGSPRPGMYPASASATTHSSAPQ